MSITLPANMFPLVNKLCVSLTKTLLSDFVKVKSSGTRLIAVQMSSGRKIEEKKVRVDDVDINYARSGSGDHPVLLLPGALGSIWTDFKPQLETLDNEKFTIVAWDPPGHGKSRPPNRTYPDNFFERDATWAHNLMRTLGYSRFSLVGWSDGGITSLIMASVYPESVRSMVVLGANSYVLPRELEIYQKVKDIDSWSEKMRAPMIATYGEEYFRKTWCNWVDSLTKLAAKRDGDICKGALSGIKCPTLIIHGAKDVMVDAEHPTYLKEHIKNSSLKIFEKGAHNLHLRYPEEFNALVTDFLSTQSKI